jgi:predicted transcriptional regulator
MKEQTHDENEYEQEYTREEVGEKIERGLAQLERGEGVDGEEFFEKLKKRGQELRARCE